MHTQVCRIQFPSQNSQGKNIFKIGSSMLVMSLLSFSLISFMFHLNEKYLANDTYYSNLRCKILPCLVPILPKKGHFDMSLLRFHSSSSQCIYFTQVQYNSLNAHWVHKVTFLLKLITVCYPRYLFVKLEEETLMPYKVERANCNQNLESETYVQIPTTQNSMYWPP